MIFIAFNDIIQEYIYITMGSEAPKQAPPKQVATAEEIKAKKDIEIEKAQGTISNQAKMLSDK